MPPYRPVAEKPDHAAIEHAILDLWEREDTFEQLREQIRGGEPFSFIDGPITANNSMGVHHAWGRSLKDCSSATRRCAAATSGTRTGSTARACGSRSRSRRRSGSTLSVRSRHTASTSS